MIVDILKAIEQSSEQVKFISYDQLPPTQPYSPVQEEMDLDFTEPLIKCGFCHKKLINQPTHDTSPKQSMTSATASTPNSNIIYSFSTRLIHSYSNENSTDETSDHCEPLADFWYLCAKCYDKGIRFCQYSEEFHFPDELVQLTDGVLVHEDQDDIIKTYKALPDAEKKNEYLEMCGITRDIQITPHNW